MNESCIVAFLLRRAAIHAKALRIIPSISGVHYHGKRHVLEVVLQVVDEEAEELYQQVNEREGGVDQVAAAVEDQHALCESAEGETVLLVA